MEKLPDQKKLGKIHELWDKLADFPVAEADGAVAFLMQAVCDLIDARHAYWLAGVRMRENVQRDALYGWRPGAIRYLNELPIDKQFYRKSVRDMKSGVASESTLNHVARAGQFRATLLKDHVSPAFYESAEYLERYIGRGVTDTLFVIFPVNPDAESYFAFHRVRQRQPFSGDDLAVAAYTLRGIKWFHRQLIMSYGLLIAGQPLSPVERKVLNELLTDKSEKRIAEALGQSLATTHKYVTAIFRKFAVKSRAGLTALWLGRQ